MDTGCQVCVESREAGGVIREDMAETLACASFPMGMAGTNKSAPEHCIKVRKLSQTKSL